MYFIISDYKRFERVVFYAKRKILVVDDDTNICELLRLYLEKRATS